MLDYDNTCAESIVEYAKRLKGKSLLEACGETIKDHGYRGKGNFGQLLEKYYFGFEPNSDAEADFYKAGIELKSTPLKQLKNKEYRAKERLVLNIINYLDIHEEEFEHSTFYQKNKHLLLVLYLHEKGVNVIDLIIHLVDEWKFPETDLQIIKHDWETIVNKIRQGKAHELSEGDTFYLGAATKGSTAASSLRVQPFSDEKAKQRAFSFKQKYLNHIIAKIARKEKKVYGKVVKHPKTLEHKTLEEHIISLYEPYYGLTPKEIEDRFGLSLNNKAKNYFANLTKAIFGVELGKKIEEFEMADIIFKTVRLKPDDLPKEDISFPTFKYEEIVETTWEESAFKHITDSKFFFVFYRIDGDNLRLEKAMFWNMPNRDIVEAKEVWLKTQALIKEGKIVESIRNGRKFSHFPTKANYRVSHVRPHARNAADTFPLPVPDQLTGATEHTKHCFWLNASYVKDEIFNK